jgi:PPOX class probable F420-dependent enzyme
MKLEGKEEIASLVLVIIYEFALRSILLCQVLHSMLVANKSDSNQIQSLIKDARVARLATIDYEEAKPHIVPVVFVFDGDSYYIPIDKKPKRNTDSRRLRRIRNIQQNPNVALLIDEYNEDWSRLFFVMIQGKGSLIGKFTESDDLRRERNTRADRKIEQLRLHKQETKSSRSRKSQYLLQNAQSLLLEKYPQYQAVSMGQLCIKVCPEKVFTWKMTTGKVG